MMHKGKRSTYLTVGIGLVVGSNSVKGFTKIDVPARCSLEDVENAIRVWNDTLQHPEKGKVLWKQEGAAVEVKNTDAV